MEESGPKEALDGSLATLPAAERLLAARDGRLATLIASQSTRWSTAPTEHPIWGLVRIVMAQQVSTQMACRLAKGLRCLHPDILSPSPVAVPTIASLRALGLSERRATCCVSIVQQSDHLLAQVREGRSWEEALAPIKGVGPWTVAVFRIMVLRDPDVLPVGDVGLLRAIETVYGRTRDVQRLGERWRPFRSVACWYLWRSLGNEPLG
jgi:DNA-3-methyladenine glycosylase II